jgi:hypothetical protein
MTARAKPHAGTRQASRDTVEIRERAIAVVEAARHSDIVERWKSQALRSIGQEPALNGARGTRSVSRFGLFAGWFRGVWRAHDAALGIEGLVAKAEALLRADDASGAVNLARRALEHALLDDYRTRLWLVTAWAGIGQRDPFLAHAALQQLPLAAHTIELVAAYLSTCNRTDEATRLVLEARKMGHRSRAASKQLIELLVVGGAPQEASRVAFEDRHLLSECDIQALVDAGIFV